MLSIKHFGKVRIDLLLDKQKQRDTHRHNEMVTKNRDILKRMINAVCFLGKQELAFRGHDESESSDNRGNYRELLDEFANLDPLLKQHFSNCTTFKGTSPTIQNDIIQAISSVMYNEILAEIDEAKFVAILTDESTDTSSKSQMSTVIRFVDLNGNTKERFLGFTNVSDDRSAGAISKHIIETIKKLKCEKKLVAQCYDGASVMAGELSGTQKRVRDEFPDALFVHCFAHKLNLVLADSVKFIKECKIFFSTVSGTSSFFSHSTARITALHEIVKKKFPKAAPTRWNYSSRIVNMIFETENLF